MSATVLSITQAAGWYCLVVAAVTAVLQFMSYYFDEELWGGYSEFRKVCKCVYCGIFEALGPLASGLCLLLVPSPIGIWAGLATGLIAIPNFARLTVLMEMFLPSAWGIRTRRLRAIGSTLFVVFYAGYGAAGIWQVVLVFIGS
jgi:hypothetical protein